jgi:hypothetical protein
VIALLFAAGLAVATPAQEPPLPGAEALVNELLGGVFKEVSARELQDAVAEAGGLPFRAPVPLDFITPADLRRYLKDLVDEEYPPARADADARLLIALDLLPPGTALRDVRMRLLEENVAGFYDERPGRKKLYAVSEDRTMTPTNQIVLAHELRHAMQDQYADVHHVLPTSVGDFDDRRVAFMAALEGDATLVMERFLLQRLGLSSAAVPDVPGAALMAPELAGVPPVLRDHLLVPYLAGRDFARALHQRGGWPALREAWGRPPRSTEQVLHPEKFTAGEEPRPVAPPPAPEGGRLILEGVLGEALTRTFLGGGSDVAAAGWGGDRYRVWDLSGRTLVVWRTEWDTPADAREFLEAARARFARTHARVQTSQGADVFGRGSWSLAMVAGPSRVTVVAGDDEGSVSAALLAASR